MLREEYSLNPCQFGFEEGVGTEVAIMHTVASIQAGLHLGAILELKGAYERVPRDKLIALLQQKLSSELATQITCMLGPMVVANVGDDRRSPPQ